jgi:hypothetical protein
MVVRQRTIRAKHAGVGLAHDPKKRALGLDPMDGKRFSEKNTLQDDA